MTDVAAPVASNASIAATDASFVTFYEEFAPRVRALAVRRLRDRDSADDVVQETLLRCFRARHRFDDSRPPWPWVKTIATNVCIDLQREGVGWREVPAGIDALEPSTPSADHTDPVQAFLASERRACIGAAMGALSPRQRRVVLLRDVEGWRANDVAAMEGSSTDAVKAALKRGRNVFRLAYTAAAGPKGLLGTAAALAATSAGAVRRLLGAKLKATTSATGIKTQLASMTTVVVATGVATIAVVGVTVTAAAGDAKGLVPLPRPTTVAVVSTPAAEPADVAAERNTGTVAAALRAVGPQIADVAAQPDELRETISAPVPGDEPIVIARVFVTTPCEGSDPGRPMCNAIATAVAAQATVESSGIPGS